LGEENVPASVGYATPAWVNNGKVLNRGLEIELEYRKKIGDFNYSIGGNIATLYNEVLEFNGFGTDPALGCTRTEKGHPISSFYLYEMEGIFQSDIDIAKHAFQAGVKPGDVKFKDQITTDDGHTDGYIDEKDRIHAGSALPKFTAGLNLSCNYKNIDFTAFFQGAYGNSIYYQVGKDIEGFYRPFTVTKRYYDEHWTPENQSNTQPRAAWSAAENNNRLSTRFLEDASYIRLKNVQIGYTLPIKIMEKAHIEKLRIYFTGTNMLTFTKYPGLDPEMTVSDNSRGEGDRSAGIDWGTYPAAKSYNIGFELSF
jgi:hypothetical protein